MEIKILSNDPNTQIFVDGALKHGPGTAPAPAPTPAPAPIPAPAPAPVPPPPLGANEYILPLNYPSATQIQQRVSLSGDRVAVVSFTVPLSVTVNPHAMGSMVTAEVPGHLRVARAIEVRVNGVVRVPYPPAGMNNTGPSLYFTVGNPGYQNIGAQFNLMPGDQVQVRCKNPNGESSDMLFAFKGAY